MGKKGLGQLHSTSLNPATFTFPNDRLALKGEIVQDAALDRKTYVV